MLMPVSSSMEISSVPLNVLLAGLSPGLITIPFPFRGIVSYTNESEVSFVPAAATWTRY